MRKLIIYISIISLFASCKKFLDVNQNPNDPATVPPSAILPTATIGIAFANANDMGRVTSLLVQHISGVANQAAQYDIYNLEGNFDNSWSLEFYNGTINNLQKLIDENSQSNPVYAGIAKLEMAYTYSVVANLWGDIPYSQAGKALQFETPRFDKIEDIYQGNASLSITSLFDLVKSGLADLDKPGIFKPSAKDDVVYSGDLSKWKKMGNTLLLKFAIQLSNVNPTLAKSTIETVKASNIYIDTNSVDFEVPFATSTGNQNPYFTFNNVNRTGDQMLSLRMLNLAKSLNDTVRLGKFFTKPTGVFVAYDNGSTATAPSVANRSKYNNYITGSSGEAPVRMLTNFQVNFIFAEAALVLGTGGDANEYYQKGIRASMQKVGIPKDSIDLYFATNPTVVTLTGTTEEMRKQIITQKYIAWIGNGIEAFDDFRRTGYPQLALANNAAGHNPNVIPTRIPYTSQEVARNPNTPNPVIRTDVKIWWAK